MLWRILKCTSLALFKIQSVSGFPMNIRHLCPLGSSMCDCFDNARDVSGEAVRARDVTPAAELHLKRSVKLQPSVRAGAAALVAGFPTEESVEDRSDGKLDCQ